MLLTMYEQPPCQEEAREKNFRWGSSSTLDFRLSVPELWESRFFVVLSYGFWKYHITALGNELDYVSTHPQGLLRYTWWAPKLSPVVSQVLLPPGGLCFENAVQDLTHIF